MKGFLFVFLNLSLFCYCEEISLTLESALTLAVNQNRQLMTAEDNTESALFQVSIAESDFDYQIKPRGDLGYIGGGKAGSGAAAGTGIDVSKKNSYGTRFSINPSVQKANNQYKPALTLMISQPLLRGFGKEYTLAHLRGAEYGYRSTMRAFTLAQSNLFIRTITALYEVLKAKKSVLLNTESYHRVRKLYQAAVLKSKIGLSDPLDVYRAEIEMRHAEDALKSSDDRLEGSEDTLRDILALSSDTSITLDLPIKYDPKEIDLERALDIAEENRVELAQAYDQEQEAIRLSMVAKERLLPEVNLVFNFANTGANEVFTSAWDFRRRESTWGVGFTTSTDFNPCAAKAGYDQALIASAAAGRNVEQIKANLSFDVKRTIRNLERTKERIALQSKQIHSAQGELRLAQIKFDRGLGNNFDLIQAEKSLRNAELAYWHALIDYIVGEYQLIGVLGMLVRLPC